MISLTEAEWEVMKILWDNENGSLSDIVRIANENGMPWAMNTVHTLLNRLVKKNAAAVDKSQSPHKYKSIIDQQQCSVAETAKLIKRIYNGTICSVRQVLCWDLLCRAFGSVSRTMNLS
jgi:predicted transcriptional regulator